MCAVNLVIKNKLAGPYATLRNYSRIIPLVKPGHSRMNRDHITFEISFHKILLNNSINHSLQSKSLGSNSTDDQRDFKTFKTKRDLNRYLKISNNTINNA